MKTKLALMFALLALVPFAIAACGDDDDDEAATEPTTTEEADAGGDAAGGGSTVSFTADPDGGLAYEEDSATAAVGTATLELTNDSSLPHDVRIESPEGEDLGGTEEITGDTTTAEVELPEPGDYTFYCSVPGHREGGMEGTLTVE